ncbi:MAG: MBL fold metallo-hydrolase [Anaerolineae bacterium]|jgi:hydroxyacylglutathione hydrolase
MLFERIESEGIAHYSYLIGDQQEAAVIDPRRDCDAYIEKASKQGLRIACILETHRNEDYAIGSPELASRTRAEIWHADEQWDYHYGQPVQDGQTWRVGRLKLRAIHSPGHTPGSMSYLLHDPDGDPWVLFSGDALFAGDVGRVDLLGVDRLEEMAGVLHETLFDRLLALPDEIIVCPAHGSGSVCGASIAERVWTTVGLERRLNPKLAYTDRDDFIANAAQELERPPYFRRMEELNLKGPPLLGALPVPTPLPPREFAQWAREGAVLDTRMGLGFGAAHVPGAQSIWMEGLGRFAGWFLDYDHPILLVNETNDPTPVVRHLIRLGYDELAGYLSGGMLAWHTAGRESQAIQMVTVQELCHRLDADEEPWILDVRSSVELTSEGEIPNAHHIYITQLPHRMGEVPRDRPVYVFCASSRRAMVGASFLQRSGWQNLIVVLGGLAGWRSTTCPIEL